MQKTKSSDTFRFAQRSSLILTLLVLMVVAGGVFFFAKNLLVSELLPELEKKSQVLGRTILRPIERGLKLGLDIRHLRGVNDHFAAARAENTEIESLNLRNNSNETLYENGVSKNQESLAKKKSHYATVSLKNGDQVLGSLDIGINFDAIDKVYRDSVYDLIAIIFVSLVIAFEVLIFVFRYRISEPIVYLMHLMGRTERGEYSEDIKLNTQDEIGLFSQTFSLLIKKTVNFLYRIRARVEIFSILDEVKGAQVLEEFKKIENQYHFNLPLKRLNVSSIFYVRLPLFLFVFAEALSNSFIPLYSRQLYVAGGFFSESMSIAFPLIFFMGAYAFSQPLYGYWAQIAPKRYAFLSGGLLYCVGIMGAAFASTLFEFTFWRCISGFGFGFFLITSQAFLMDFMTPGKRVRNMTMFMGGYYAASVCGIPIGGLLAEGVGYRSTFFVILVVALISVFYTQVYMSPPTKTKDEQPKMTLSVSPAMELLKNGDFIKFLGFIAIPSRILMAACILYALPVHLKSMDYSTSLIARIMMIYSLMIYGLGYVFGKYIDQKNNALAMILCGSFLASASGLILGVSSGFWAIICFMFVFGLGHSISLTAQITVPPLLHKEHEREENGSSMTTTLGVYRFFEIMGFAVGPFLMGLLLHWMDSREAIIVLSAPCVILVILYGIFAFKSANRLIRVGF